MLLFYHGSPLGWPGLCDFQHPAKGLVTRYAQGLQHRFVGGGVKVVLIMARLMPR